MDTIIAVLIFFACAYLVMTVFNFIFGEDTNEDKLEPW